MSAPSPLRTGLVGCGVFARQLSGVFPKSGHTLVACASRRNTSARAFAEWLRDEGQPMPEVCPDVSALLARDDVEVVVLTTPPHVHAEHCVAALDAGKHVICEKPSSLGSDEDARIAEAATRSGKTIAFTSSRLRYGGYTEAVEHAMSQGMLGEVYRVEVRFNRPCHRPGIDWQCDQTWFSDKALAGGGVLFDMGGYFLDQVMHLLDWPAVRTVDATTFRGHPHDLPADRIHNVEEHATVLARLRGADEREIALSLELSACAHEPARHTVTILGTESGITLSHGEANRFDRIRVLPVEGAGGRLFRENALWDASPWNSELLFRGMADHVRDGAPPPGTTMAEAIRITDFLEHAYDSAEAGREVTVDPLQENAP